MMISDNEKKEFIDNFKNNSINNRTFLNKLCNNELLKCNLNFKNISSNEIIETIISLHYHITNVNSYSFKILNEFCLNFTNKAFYFLRNYDNIDDIFNGFSNYKYNTVKSIITKISCININSFNDFLNFDKQFNIIDITDGFEIHKSNISCGILLANGLNFQEFCINFSNKKYEILCLLADGNVVLLKINFEDTELLCNIRYYILKKTLSNMKSSICILSTNINYNSYFKIIDDTFTKFFKKNIISETITYNKNSSNDIKTYILKI